MTTRVGLLPGDACGIGPEILARLLASGALEPEVQTVVMAIPACWRAEIAGATLNLPVLNAPAARSHEEAHRSRTSRHPEGGRAGGRFRSTPASSSSWKPDPL